MHWKFSNAQVSQSEYVNRIQDLYSGVDGELDLNIILFISRIFQTNVVLFHPGEGCVQYPEESEHERTVFLLNWRWRCFDPVLFTPLSVCGRKRTRGWEGDGGPIRKAAKQ